MSDINWDEMPWWADSYCQIDRDNIFWMSDKLYGYIGNERDQPLSFGESDIYEVGFHKLENTVGKRVYPPETKPVWNGVGIPPVGTVCEFSSEGHHDGFMWCIFRGCMSDGGFIIEYHHATSPEMVTCDCFDPDLTKFRPIKSDKERWVDDSLSILLKNPAACPREYMGMLYDALISGELPLPKGDK